MCGLVLVAAWALLMPKELGAADLFIETSRSTFDPIPVAVFPFQTDDWSQSLGFSPTEVLKADLKRSQLFRVENIDDIADLRGESPKPALVQRVSTRGVHVSVWGKLDRRGDEFFLDAFLYEGEAGRKVLRKVYTGSKAVVRAMVHRLSNMIIQRYSGQRGVANTQIAFVAEVDDGKAEANSGKQIYVMDYDGYRPRPYTNNQFLNLFPHWSPGKRFLAFTSYLDDNPDIHVMDLTTGKRRNMVAFEGANITPAWSPDGKQLAFASSFDGDSDIYTIQASDGTKLRQLTFSPASDFSPTWAPSGIEIAFSSDRGGSLQIYVMDADGSNVRRLAFEGRYNTAPAWSPDGRWIAYTCRNRKGSLKICRVTPDGRQTVQVTQGVGDHESASWSPDGRHIVFSAASHGKSDIYVVHYEGAGLERLTSGTYRASSPTWSPWE
jgi:TolB protein